MMTIRLNTLTSWVSTCLIFTSSIATACIHPEAEGGEVVSTPAQEYAVFYNAGRQTLMISLNVEMNEGSAAGLSMVTATPTLPDSYTTGDPALFADLYTWYHPPTDLSDQPRSGDANSADGPELDGIEVGTEVETGPYRITPIEVSGPGGVEALNTWLTENGYVRLDRELAQSYADKGWYFLAVDIRPGSMDQELESGRLPPLEISFDTREVVVPLKLEAGMGPFDIRMYLFLDSQLPTDTGAKYGLEAMDGPTSISGAPTRVQETIARFQTDGLVANSTVYTYQLHSDGLINTTDAPILAWPEDFAFLLDTAPDEVIDTPPLVPTTPMDNDAPADTESPTANQDQPLNENSGGGCSVGSSRENTDLAWLGVLLLIGLRNRRR